MGTDKRQKLPAEPAEVELRPDGWERFERAVDAAVASGPRHRHPKSLVVLSEWHKRIVSEVADLAFHLARLVTDEWGKSILVPHSLFENQSPKGVQVAGSPFRVTVPGELVRIDFDQDETMIARTAEIRRFFRVVARPYLESFGDLVLEDLPPSGIVIRRKRRRERVGHEVRS